MLLCSCCQELDLLLHDGCALLELTSELKRGQDDVVARVDATLSRLLIQVADHASCDLPSMCNLFDDDACMLGQSILGRMRKDQFALSAANMVKRMQQAVSDGCLRRVASDAHSLSGMALYSNSATIAHSAQTLEEVAAEEDADAVASQLEEVARRVASLSPCLTDDVVHSEFIVNLLARRSLQQDLDRISHAASRKDIESLRAGALELKQMALCHGRTFELLAIAAYELQLAASSASFSHAVSHVQPVIDAGRQMIGILTLEIAHPPTHCSLRSVPGCQFFSHAITVPSAHAIEAADASADNAGCLVAPPAEDPANLLSCPLTGDTIALANTVTAFLQLLPVWVRSAQQAINECNFILLNIEAWILGFVARLLGAERLASLATEMNRAMSFPRPLRPLRQLLVQIRCEVRVVIAYFGQQKSHQICTTIAAMRSRSAGTALELPVVASAAPLPSESIASSSLHRTLLTPTSQGQAVPSNGCAHALNAMNGVRPLPTLPSIGTGDCGHSQENLLTASACLPPSTFLPSSKCSTGTIAFGITCVPKHALRFLIDATCDACNSCMAEGGSDTMMLAAETAFAAAHLVDGLLTRASERGLTEVS